jgi:putative copper export protein
MTLGSIIILKESGVVVGAKFEVQVLLRNSMKLGLAKRLEVGLHGRAEIHVVVTEITCHHFGTILAVGVCEEVLVKGNRWLVSVDLNKTLIIKLALFILLLLLAPRTPLAFLS